MSKRIMCLLSFALALGLVSTGYVAGKTVVYDFETGSQGWGGLKDGTGPTLSPETHSEGGSQSLRITIDEAVDVQQQGGWSSPRDFTAADADVSAGGYTDLSFWYRVDDSSFNGGNFVYHWIMSTQAWSGGGWLGNGQWGVVIADGQWHQQTADLSILSTAAGGWDGVWGDQTEWRFADDLLYNIEIAVEPTDNTTGSNMYIDDIQIFGGEEPPAPTSSIVVGNFEGDLDGWFQRDATLSFSTTGATLGTQAMQVDGPGGWHQNALLDLKPHRLLLSAPGAAITADVTAFDADMTTTWMNVELVINAQNNDDSGANNNVGWQSLGAQDIIRDGQSHTFTWAIPDSLRSVIAGVDDNISWFELVLVTNLDAASVTRFYIDNVQLVSEAPTESPDKSTDVIIGNWEQNMDGWVVGGTADVLFNDHNGVTLDNYSLDIYAPTGAWQSVITRDVIGTGLLDLIKINKKISVDVTRLVADWPTDQSPGWDGIHMIINAGGDGWSLWQDMGYQAGWVQSNGDLTQTATWDYGQYFSLMDLDNVGWFNLEVVVNANDEAYTGWVLFYLDNMKLFGGGTALDPKPASGAADVPIDSKLSWTPGAFATSHHVYFGTDAAKVLYADMDSDPNVTFAALDANSFDPNDMEFKTKYFWRVDEVNEANPDSPWKGLVWSFTSANFLVIDDFESYNDINPGEAGSNRILETWKDGYLIESNGALVGNDFPPYAEQTTVQNGIQSMPFLYDNTGAALQSEAQRVWAEPQVWMTSVGTNTLKLYIHGAAQNTAGELYVIIEDNAGISTRVPNLDSTIFTAEEWKEWNISLNDVAATGLNLAAVKKLVIGIADLAGQPEAKGKIYVDDIRRYPPVVVNIEPDILLVPKTSVAPVIDGQSDAVWDAVNGTQCLITDIINADSAAPENTNDLSATFKTMFDDNNFYIFVEVQDSVIDHEFSDWQGDGVELYFDGDYSHGEAYDGVNDNQVRITVDDVALADIDSSLPVAGTVFKVVLTASGYNIEASFPLEALQIYPSEDPAPLVDADGVEIPNSGIALNNIIGFEVQINDNDSAGGRQTMMRWHSDDNGSWGNASLFGQARLVSSTVEN